MTKPKELTGRVRSLSELIGLAIVNPYTNTDVERLNDIDRFNDFYSQPFTPELLDYFEGWEMFQETEKWKYYQPVEETNIMVSAYENKDLYFVVCEDEQAGSIKLNVLNDFVTLCSLAWVELNWKE